MGRQYADASATLYFGILLPTLQLAWTGAAWSSLKGVLLALDLISSRNRTGTLNVLVGGGSALSRVSQEIWDKIKAEVVCVELDEAEKTFASQMACRDCERECPPMPFEGVERCEGCLDALRAPGGSMSWAQDRAESIVELLSSFGLFMPSDEAYHPEEERWGDPYSLSGIAHGGASNLPFVRVDSDCEYPATSEVATIDPSTFSLPSTASSRLLNFATLFRLNSVTPPFSPGVTPYTASGQDEPQWRMWAVCDAGWD